MGITGAFLAYEYELDRALNPKLFRVVTRGDRLPLTRLVEAVQVANPSAKISAIDLAALAGNRRDISYQIDILEKAHVEPTHVFIDPYTADILGRREGPGFPALIHEFHSNLLLGKPVKRITTILSAGMVALAISGLVLWWPRKLVGISFRSSAARLNFDLHNTVGICMSLFLLLFGVTGIGVYLADSLAPAIDRMSGAANQHEPAVYSQGAPSATPTIYADAAAAIAAKVVPGAQVTYINLPQSPRDGYRVRLKFREDRQTLGRSYAHVDQYSGKVLWSQSTRETAAGTRYFKFWNREVHNGTAFGVVFQLSAVVTGLAVPLLAITGPVSGGEKTADVYWGRCDTPWLPKARGQPTPLRLHDTHETSSSDGSNCRLSGGAPWSRTIHGTQTGGCSQPSHCFELQPGDRPAFRRAISTDTVLKLAELKKKGSVQSYRVLFNRFLDSDTWDVLILAEFANNAGPEKSGRKLKLQPPQASMGKPRG